MFSGGMLESQRREIELQGLSPDVLRDVVKFIYCDEIKVHNDNVQAIFSAAHLLQLDDLCLTCSRYMQVYTSIFCMYA